MRTPPRKPAKTTPVDFGSDRTSPGLLELDRNGFQRFDGQSRRDFWVDALLVKLRARLP